ncbi:MAG: VTT domain-containing protein [Pyrinomonadaceae bacterium]
MARFGFLGRLRERFVEMGKLTPIALVTTFLPMTGTAVLFMIGYPLGLWLKENQVVGAFGYATGVLIFCGLALVPTNVIGVIGGFAFGFDLGLVLLMLAVVGASLISFFIHRRIVGDKVPDVADNHPKARAVYQALLGQGFWRTTTIILLIRFSIIMPFALTNFILASAKVSVAAFLTGTFLGMLPRSSAVVLAGAGLSELSLETPYDVWMVSFGIAASLLSIIVISIISKRALERLTQIEA